VQLSHLHGFEVKRMRRQETETRVKGFEAQVN
jgi:hypothetical protein